MNKNNHPLTQHIYILGDRSNLKLAKIGISQQIVGRLQQHNTSNPNAYLYFKKEYDFQFAVRIEKTIKNFYKSVLASGSEWFNITCADLEKFLMVLINAEMTSNDFNSKLSQGKSITELSYEQQEFFTVDKNNEYSDIKKENAKLLFSQSFNIGIPLNLLPNNVLKNNGFPINFDDCDINSVICKTYFVENLYNKRIISKDDHIDYFYYLLPLNSGSFFAYPISRVSLPYIEYDLNYKDKKNIVEQAQELGWSVTFHNEWSWHNPPLTGLVVFTNNANLNTLDLQWKNSLKKWVIENIKILENYFCFDGVLQKDINAIMYEIKENINFPLNIQSFEEFYKSPYLDIKLQVKSQEHINGNKDLELLEFRHNLAYRILFRLWRASVKITNLNKQTIKISKKRIVERVRRGRLLFADVLWNNFQKKNLPHKEKEFNILREKYLSNLINYESFVELSKQL